MNKKLYKITAIVMACALLLSICSFAVYQNAYYQDNPIVYSCSAGYASSSASTSYALDNFTCWVTLDVGHQYYVGSTKQYGSASNSSSDKGYASTSCDYINGHYAYAVSSHQADGWTGSLTDTYGTP